MPKTTIHLKQSEALKYPSPHHWLAAELKLPAHYGHNLDALWDCLSGELPMPLNIVWHNDCQTKESYASIIELFQEAGEEIEGFIFQYIEEN